MSDTPKEYLTTLSPLKYLTVKYLIVGAEHTAHKALAISS